MGGFPSMMESGSSAGVHPHPPVGQSTATPSIPPGSNQLDMQSPLNSGQTNGRGEGLIPTFRSGNLARVRSRALLMKRLLKGRIVFLGLDGAGKTTLIQQFLRQSSIDASEEDDDLLAQCIANPGDLSSRSTHGNMLVSSSSNGDLSLSDDKLPKLYPDPTKAAHSVAYRLEPERFVQLVDVPGGRKFRSTRWRGALLGESSFQDLPATTATGAPISFANLPIVGIVFVVDATDQTRFPLVAQELVRLQKLRDQPQQRTSSGSSSSLAHALQRAPFFLVLNKVDASASHSNKNNSNSGVNDTVTEKQIQERRRASRQLRQELKKAFDHQLRLDQKRHPRDYAATVAAAGGGDPQHQTASTSTKKQALAEANSNRKTVLMTSIAECCAFDRDSVRSLQSWVRDEVRRLWTS